MNGGYSSKYRRTSPSHEIWEIGKDGKLLKFIAAGTESSCICIAAAHATGTTIVLLAHEVDDLLENQRRK